jgi:hypothetical protein
MLVITAFIALLCGGYILIFETGEPGGSKDRNVLGKPRSFFTDLTAFEVKSGSLSVTFEKRDDKWYILSPSEYPADKSRVENIVDELDLAAPDRTVTDVNEKIIREHGLADPRHIIRLTGKNNERMEVRIGNETAETSEKIYVMVEGKGDIFVIRDSILDYLAASAEAYRSVKTIDVTPVDVTKLQLTGLWDLTLEHMENDWKLTAPFKAIAGKLESENLCSSATDLKVAKFVDDKPSDFAKYGLDNTVSVVVVVDKEGAEQRLLLGSETEFDKDGKKVKGRFAKMTQRNNVFIIAEESLAKLPKVTTDLVEKKLSEIDYVQFLLMDFTGGVDSFRIEMKENSLKFVGETERDADGSAMEEFHKLLRDVSATEIHLLGDDLTKWGLDGSHRFEINPGRPGMTTHLKLEIGRYDSEAKGWYVRRNDEGVALLIPEGKFKRVVESGRFDFLERQIARFKAQDVTYVSLMQEGRSLSVTRVDDVWKCDNKPEAKVEETKLKDALKKLEMFESLRTTRFEANSEKLGSVTPRAKLVVTTTTKKEDGTADEVKTVVFHFGADFQDGDAKGVYCWIAGDDFAFVVPNTIYQLLAEKYITEPEAPKPEVSEAPKPSEAPAN